MNRRIGLIALAVVLALAGTLAVYSYAHNADERAVEKTRSTSVLYAARKIPVGTTWKQAKAGDYLTEEKVPIDAAPSSAIDHLTAAIPDDEVAAADIAAGQIAVRGMFAGKQADTGILAIPKGKQAVSVSLPSSADVAGFVQSGSEVAIYATFRIGGGTKNESTDGVFGGENGDPKVYVTKLLLPRVDVIATSQNAPSELDGAKKVSQSQANNDNVLVTFAVDQKSAERLILAQTTGQLYLSLLTTNSVVGPGPGTLNVGILKPAPIFSLSQ